MYMYYHGGGTEIKWFWSVQRFVFELKMTNMTTEKEMIECVCINCEYSLTIAVFLIVPVVRTVWIYALFIAFKA